MGKIILPDGVPATLRYPLKGELPELPEIPRIRGWARCMICKKPVDSCAVEAVSGDRTRIECRVQCHGAEDVVKVKLTDEHRWRMLAWGVAFAGGNNILLSLNNPYNAFGV